MWENHCGRVRPAGEHSSIKSRQSIGYVVVVFSLCTVVLANFLKRIISEHTRQSDPHPTATPDAHNGLHQTVATSTRGSHQGLL